MTRLEVLKGARALLAKPGGWCKQVLARNQNGLPVDLYSDDAVSFCFRGAVMRAAGLEVISEVERFEAPLLRLLPGRWKTNNELVFFNNAQQSAEPVIALLDRGIASLERRKRA